MVGCATLLASTCKEPEPYPVVLVGVHIVSAHTDKGSCRS